MIISKTRKLTLTGQLRMIDLIDKDQTVAEPDARLTGAVFDLRFLSSLGAVTHFVNYLGIGVPSIWS